MASSKQDESQYPVTVFYLDDQRSVTKSVKKMLQHAPHLYFHECNAPELAIQHILNIGPTVILLDLHMPEIDGFEILSQLQTHEAIQDIPVLILTIDTSITSKQRAFELGASDYLIKIPCEAELMLRLRYHTRVYINHLEREAKHQALLEKQRKLQAMMTKAEQASLEDSLTKVANRRAFDQYFTVEWQRAMRETTPLSLMFIDIDHFKAYNDFYGHVAGDDCLKQVAQALHTTLQRPTDLLARYGGEDFVVLLPNTHGQGAMLIADRLRKAVLSLHLEHQQSLTNVVVSISLGIVTTSPMIKHHANDFIQAANQALNQSKQAGRNCVTCKSI